MLKGASQETGRRLCAHGCADHWPLPSPASKPRARRQLDSAFPRMNRETKKRRERPVARDGGTRRGSRTILAELPIRRLAHSGLSMRAGWPSLFRSPGFSLPLRPALDSQPQGLRQWPRSAGGEGSGSAGEDPHRVPAVEGLPWNWRVPGILTTSGRRVQKTLEISLPCPSRRAG